MVNVNRFVKKSPSPSFPLPCILLSYWLSSLMYFSVRTHSHSRIVNRRQLQIFSMPNISQVSATHRRWPQIASLIIQTARLSLAWTSTVLPPKSPICQRLKNRAKIVQCELGISVKNIYFVCWSHKCSWCVTSTVPVYIRWSLIWTSAIQNKMKIKIHTLNKNSYFWTEKYR